MDGAYANTGVGVQQCVFPIVIPLPVLTLLNDAVQITIPVNGVFKSAEMSLGNLTIGPFTVTLTNDVGQLLATLTLNARGTTGMQNVSNPAVSAGGKLHVNITGLGVAATSACIIIWFQTNQCL